MVGFENLDELSLCDDPVSFFVEGHEGELELVFFASTRVVGDGDEELWTNVGLKIINSNYTRQAVAK